MDAWYMSIDRIVTGFLAGSILTLGAIGIVIRAVSEQTQWSWDNKVADAYAACFAAISELFTRNNKGSQP